MSAKCRKGQEMAFVKVKETIPSGDSAEVSKKCRKKKKKSKELKRDKPKKRKCRAEEQQWLRDDAHCCESISFTQMPEIKKRKKKKTNGATLNEQFPQLLTHQNRPNLSKRLKLPKGYSLADLTQTFKPVAQPVPMRSVSEERPERSTPVKNIHHKRKVMFKLLPEEIPTVPKRDPVIQTQPPTDKPHTPETMFSGNGKHSKTAAGENISESQSTPENVNSQDLFITQKTFSEPYEDISCSPSTDEGATVPPYQTSTQYRPAPRETPSSKQTSEASTQTENFFTSPGLATSLRFHHQSTASMCTEEPMDLSLPRRPKPLGPCGRKPVEDQALSESKAVDLTSSDESDTLSKSKADLCHLKVVQTRLNESFFFRVKGEGDSPKPRSPLMVLPGSADKKPKK